MAGNIFVSYRRDDSKHAAGRLVDRLQTEFHEGQLFLDVDNIELGLDFIEVIHERVSACDVMLVVIGPQWLSATTQDGSRRLDDPNDFVRLEVEVALKRNIRVIPVLVDGAEPPRATELPESLSSLANRQSTRLAHESFISDANALTTALIRIVGRRDEQSARDPPTRSTGSGAFPQADDTAPGGFREGTRPTRLSWPKLLLAPGRNTADPLAQSHPDTKPAQSEPKTTAPTRNPRFDLFGWFVAIAPPLLFGIFLLLLGIGAIRLPILGSLSKDQNLVFLPLVGSFGVLALSLLRRRRASLLLKFVTFLIYSGSVVFFFALA